MLSEASEEVLFLLFPLHSDWLHFDSGASMNSSVSSAIKNKWEEKENDETETRLVDKMGQNGGKKKLERIA